MRRQEEQPVGLSGRDHRAVEVDAHRQIACECEVLAFRGLVHVVHVVPTAEPQLVPFEAGVQARQAEAFLLLPIVGATDHANGGTLATGQRQWQGRSGREEGDIGIGVGDVVIACLEGYIPILGKLGVVPGQIGVRVVRVTFG